jgi:hypothetical protein
MNKTYDLRSRQLLHALDVREEERALNLEDFRRARLVSALLCLGGAVVIVLAVLLAC